MTTFVLSHNLQVQSDFVPALDFELLAQELKSLSKNISSTEVLNHPHWKLSISSDLSPQDMAVNLVQTWSEYRRQLGHEMNHFVLALGGRKDSQASPGAPLQEGYWGVDLVETPDKTMFLQAINWQALKAGRSEDAIFEVSS
ncbi:DUF2656 domain-containing protein [Synechococcus sp. MU1643]|uniref:DUF2656 family protein n=1 Tax=Synechococcus sp. MU1643 TaxID=2508349 RepID=UPI001CF907F7|nr:DUF2656 family protein [Synechococcus sp. MU1643]MCB4428844.1 DUF2656 domain-containing protein [Synechococcus sp. MU1643]